MLSLGFAWTSLYFRNLSKADWGELGRRVTRTVLILLAIDFAFSVWAFGFLMGAGVPLPGAYAHFTSLYDLTLEMLLAFGCVVLAMQDASRRIHTLTSLLPVCAWCRKIRDDHGYWTEFEEWVKSQGDVAITHGICPSCRTKAFPESAGDDGRA